MSGRREGLAETTHRMLPMRIVVGSGFTLAVAVIAALAAWPIYRTGAYVLLVVVATLVGAAIAAIAHARRWSAWLVAAALAGAIALLGVPLAVPTRLGGLPQLIQGLGEVGAGVAFAWKDLVTVELPVGSYRNLLVPALVMFLVGTCATLMLSWRKGRIAFLSIPVGFAMVSFGLFFGRTVVSDPLVVGPFELHAPAETAIGIASLLSALLWLAWRSRDERVRALERAAASSGVRVSRRPSSADRRRGALGAGMIAVAVVATVAVVPFAARGADREVLRSAAGPDIDLASEVSPLAAYRSLFSDATADQILFTVTGDGALPDRVRVATLDSYDGEVFRTGGGSTAEEARFVRVPASLPTGEGTAYDVVVTVDALDGIWMPTAGQVESAAFRGPRATALADRFYYSSSAQAGVQTAGGGFREGDSYRLNVVVPTATDLAAIDAPGGVTGVAVPEHVTAWVEEHVEGTGGAALAGLVALLRERGYLSHALALQEEGDVPVWMQSLEGYDFQPSAAGHSLARIDGLFDRLLTREADPRAEASDNYVAAVGDDEQFAVAVALMARELGFPSRVVLGARLSSADAALAVCDQGACRAQDLAVWTEVQSTEGEWVAIDATPQYAQSPSLEVTEQRDPQNVTEVRPDAVTEVVPPEPLQEDSSPGESQDPAAGLDLAWMWPVARISGIVLAALLIVLGPLLVVVAAKAARRRGRRTQGVPSVRIAGGWDEYVDAAVDTGRDAVPARTRSELAEAFETTGGATLADAADRAVFGSAPASDADAEAFWRIVEDERRALLRERGFWKRLAATVSLRSFFRHLAPAAGRRPSPRSVERGTRRAELTQTTS